MKMPLPNRWKARQSKQKIEFEALSQLLHSTDQIAELRLTRGCFVARAGAELPEGAAPLWHFKIEGVDLTLFTVI